MITSRLYAAVTLNDEPNGPGLCRANIFVSATPDGPEYDPCERAAERDGLCGLHRCMSDEFLTPAVSVPVTGAVEDPWAAAINDPTIPW